MDSLPATYVKNCNQVFQSVCPSVAADTSGLYSKNYEVDRMSLSMLVSTLPLVECFHLNMKNPLVTKQHWFDFFDRMTFNYWYIILIVEWHNRKCRNLGISLEAACKTTTLSEMKSLKKLTKNGTKQATNRYLSWLIWNFLLEKFCFWPLSLSSHSIVSWKYMSCHRTQTVYCSCWVFQTYRTKSNRSLVQEKLLVNNFTCCWCSKSQSFMQGLCYDYSIW